MVRSLRIRAGYSSGHWRFITDGESSARQGSCSYQPDEPPLQMTVPQLTAVRDAARQVAGQPGAHVFGGFLIVNGPARAWHAQLALRGLWAKIRPPRAG